MEENSRVKYYERDFPAEGELVIARCSSCEENGCYVELLEYENRVGMIPLNEYSISMKKSIHRAMKVGKVDAVRVIRVDANKGYIDLSKSKVSVEDENAAKDKFAKAKGIHSIMLHVAEASKTSIADLYTNIVWPLYRREAGAHPLDIIKMIMAKEDRINDLGIEREEVKAVLLDEVKRRFKRPILKTVAVFEVSIKLFDGIGVLKKVLRAGQEASKEKGYDIRITTLGAPIYLVEVQTATKEEGEDAIMCGLDRIRDFSKALDPSREFDIKKKPKVVGDSTARIHELLVEELEHENAADSDGMADEDDEDA